MILLAVPIMVNLLMVGLWCFGTYHLFHLICYRNRLSVWRTVLAVLFASQMVLPAVSFGHYALPVWLLGGELRGGVPGLNCTEGGIRRLYDPAAGFLPQKVPRVVDALETCMDDEVQLLGYSSAIAGTKCCIPAPRGRFACDNFSLVLSANSQFVAALLSSSNDTRASYASCCPTPFLGLHSTGAASLVLRSSCSVLVAIFLNIVWMLCKGRRALLSTAAKNRVVSVSASQVYDETGIPSTPPVASAGDTRSSPSNDGPAAVHALVEGDPNRRMCCLSKNKAIFAVGNGMTLELYAFDDVVRRKRLETPLKVIKIECPTLDDSTAAAPEEQRHTKSWNPFSDRGFVEPALIACCFAKEDSEVLCVNGVALFATSIDHGTVYPVHMPHLRGCDGIFRRPCPEAVCVSSNNKWVCVQTRSALLIYYRILLDSRNGRWSHPELRHVLQFRDDVRSIRASAFRPNSDTLMFVHASRNVVECDVCKFPPRLSVDGWVCCESDLDHLKCRLFLSRMFGGSGCFAVARSSTVECVAVGGCTGLTVFDTVNCVPLVHAPSFAAIGMCFSLNGESLIEHCGEWSNLWQVARPNPSVNLLTLTNTAKLSIGLSRVSIPSSIVDMSSCGEWLLIGDVEVAYRYDEGSMRRSSALRVQLIDVSDSGQALRDDDVIAFNTVWYRLFDASDLLKVKVTVEAVFLTFVAPWFLNSTTLVGRFAAMFGSLMVSYADCVCTSCIARTVRLPDAFPRFQVNANAGEGEHSDRSEWNRFTPLDGFVTFVYHYSLLGAAFLVPLVVLLFPLLVVAIAPGWVLLTAASLVMARKWEYRTEWRVARRVLVVVVSICAAISLNVVVVFFLRFGMYCAALLYTPDAYPYLGSALVDGDVISMYNALFHAPLYALQVSSESLCPSLLVSDATFTLLTFADFL